MLLLLLLAPFLIAVVTKPRTPPRFPYVPAMIAVAALFVAGKVWMRYAYCWDVRPPENQSCDCGKHDLLEEGGLPSPVINRYARVTGRLQRTGLTVRAEVHSYGGRTPVALWRVAGDTWHVHVTLPETGRPSEGAEVSLEGRVSHDRAEPRGGGWLSRKEVYLLETGATRLVDLIIFSGFVAIPLCFYFALSVKEWVQGKPIPPPKVDEGEKPDRGCAFGMLAGCLMLFLGFVGHIVGIGSGGSVLLLALGGMFYFGCSIGAWLLKHTGTEDGSPNPQTESGTTKQSEGEDHETE
ncbi:MAG: hypothetical protein ACYS9X_03400 [Planctomycetota bacterium]